MELQIDPVYPNQVGAITKLPFLFLENIVKYAIAEVLADGADAAGVAQDVMGEALRQASCSIQGNEGLTAKAVADVLGIDVHTSSLSSPSAWTATITAQHAVTAHNFEACGGFSAQLGDLWAVADSANRAKMASTWPEQMRGAARDAVSSGLYGRWLVQRFHDGAVLRKD